VRNDELTNIDIADEVLASMQKRLRDFVANAHSVMLSDQEIKAADLAET
jgi:hypothetical protein